MLLPFNAQLSENGQVNALIDEANEQWDERNARAAEAGEPEVPRMLPLVRLKVGDLFLPRISTNFKPNYPKNPG